MFRFHEIPHGPLAQFLERSLDTATAEGELRDELERYTARLWDYWDPDVNRFAIQVENLGKPAPIPGPATEGLYRPVPEPAAAGSPVVLDTLKRWLNPRLGPAEASVTRRIGPDQFPIRGDSPLTAEHEWLSKLFPVIKSDVINNQVKVADHAVGKRLLAMEPVAVGRLILAAAERHVATLMTTGPGHYAMAAAARVAVRDLARGRFTLDRDGVFDLALYFATRPIAELGALQPGPRSLVEQASAEAARSPLTEGERYVLSACRAAFAAVPGFGQPSEVIRGLTRMIGDGMNFYLAAGEAWTDEANAEISRLGPVEGQAWGELLAHTHNATSARPSERWLASAVERVEAVGGEQVEQALARWFPLVARGPSTRKLPAHPSDTRSTSGLMVEANATVLRGLLWLIPLLPEPGGLARSITAVALSAYKKVPGIGPRSVKVGSSAIDALAALKTTDAVGQLAILKVRVKIATAQKPIEKAFTTAAEALGLPRDQIEELGVPSYGLEEVGRSVETLGDDRAELVIDGTDAELRWSDAQGKPLKAAPATVKSKYKEELKELQNALKDIRAMLPAQRDRIDSLFLARKSWPLEAWRERFGDHPLVGTLARRLIWRLAGTPVVFHDGEPIDVDGHKVKPGPEAEVTLWHPIECPTEEVLAWRDRLETLRITQPFKQAHREVYLLTDAERTTATYSNRFAAHVVRQHQFNALCAARGWKNQLRLMVDSSYAPPSKELPGWGLRAEFWVDGIGNDYASDTNESGVYLRLATDQVRFYRLGAAANWTHVGDGRYTSSATGPGDGNINEPLPLDQVPPLVFSEVMRDADLFVGVASVGNDPTWQDGGPEGQFRTYWQDYSFGELSGTAATRKQVLERLIPRLKIAKQCSFADRFLLVQGQKRTYKIHLGSGNILMEPNDQYLCIVPDARARADQGSLFLPFEGDGMLSIILSKALLLADDARIKDRVILNQINSH